jgi:hypothetical protein
MPSITFDIPEHVSEDDAKAIIASFMAAQNAHEGNNNPPASADLPGPGEVVSQHGPITIVSDAPTDGAIAQDAVVPETVVAHEDDEQDNAVDDQRSYASTPGDGAIPTVEMLIQAREGGLLGSMAAQREAQERDAIAENITAYGDAAREAADDPDRKRPPRAEPDLVDAAVKMVVRLMHARTRRYIMGEGDNGGMDEQWNPDAEYEIGERERVSDNEQAEIGFTISNVRKWIPYTMCHNYRHTGWGIIELIEKEYNATFTKAQVRSSIKRLTESGFLTESGMCGKSSRYRLTDVSEYLFTKQDDDA